MSETKVEQIEDVLSERVAAAINRRVAEALYDVAQSLRNHYTSAYYGMGGPQDGDDSPASFDAQRAAEDIERRAREYEIQ